MLKRHHRGFAASLAALALTLANAGPGTADNSRLTRAQVLHELQQARADNRLTPGGEIGDTPAILAAREAFHTRQTAAFHNRHQHAEPALADSQALDELVADLQARDFEGGADAMTSAD